MGWSYRDGPAPWDVGQPQPAVVRVGVDGRVRRRVLDVGCGTGENALHIASLGLHVLGVDVAPKPRWRWPARRPRMWDEAEFAVADAFALGRLGRMFDTVLDCGLFHTLTVMSGEATWQVRRRSPTVAGALYVLCFSGVESPHCWRPASCQSGGAESGIPSSQRLGHHRREPGRCQTRSATAAHRCGS